MIMAVVERKEYFEEGVERWLTLEDETIASCDRIMGASDNALVQLMAGLVKTIKKQGASAVVQLSHAGPRCPTVPGKRHGFSPSGVRFRPDVESIVMNAGD